jgi:hypothetical protein
MLTTTLHRGRTKAQTAKEMGVPEDEVAADQYDAVVLHGETLTVMNEEQWAEVTDNFKYMYLQLAMTVCVCVLTAHCSEVELRYSIRAA